MLIATLLGALAVLLGAFGAHALKAVVLPERLPIFETGVRYQFYHVFALFIVYFLQNAAQNAAQNVRFFEWAGYFFTFGIVLFSGSLYLLACRDVLPFSVAFAGPVTPLGGVCCLLGWCALARGVYSK